MSGLSQIYDLFAIEDLQIANLLRSAKGTAAEPGRIVQAKIGLNRANFGQGRGKLFGLLRSGLRAPAFRWWKSRRMEPASPARDAEPKSLVVRVHASPACRLILDRDVNAARNFLHRALARFRVGSGGMCPLPVAAAGPGNRGFSRASGAVATLAAEQCHPKSCI